MHDKFFKQGNCRGGEGRGGVLIVSHNHISHELSSEANYGSEGIIVIVKELTMGRSSGT